MHTFYATTGRSARRRTRQVLSALVAAAAISACSGDKKAVPTRITEPTNTVALTVSGSGTGSGRVMSTPGGIDCALSAGTVSGTCSARFTSGALVTLQPQPGTTSVFLTFGGDCALASCQTTMEAPRTVTATFVPNVLSVVANTASVGGGRIVSTPVGIDCILNGTAAGAGSCSATFPLNTEVTLLQEPVAGAIFQAWSANCTGNPCVVTMTGQRTIDATYRMPSAPGTLSVGGFGTGAGTVTSLPDGINCTITAGSVNGTCAAVFAGGLNVTLNAVSTGSSAFSGFTGACAGTACTATVVSGTTTPVGAGFAAASMPATLVVAPTAGSRGGGVITSAPAGINCTVNDGITTGVCSVTFTTNTVVTLSQIPAGSGIFQGWSGDCIGNPCQVTVAQNHVAEVTYRAPPSGIVAVSAVGTGSGTITSAPAGIACTITNGVAGGGCSASFDAGVAVTLSAVSAGTASFSGYTGACSGGSCSIIVSSGATTQVGAGFLASIPATLTVRASPASRGSGVITSSPAGINCTVHDGAASGVCNVAFASSTIVTLTQIQSGASIFRSWSGDCVGNPCQITMSSPRVGEITYRIPPPGIVTVTGTGSGTGSVTSSPSGISCTISAGVMSGLCSATFDAGSTVSLIGGSTNNGSFDGFTGACTGGSCAIAVASSLTSAVSAAFSAAPQRLTVTAGPGSAGGGVITSSPAGINCVMSGSTTSGACTAFFAFNTVVTLQQSTVGNAVFASWAGDCASDPCQLAMSEGRTALGILQTQTVAVTGGGTGSGLVTSVPSGITCTVTNGLTGGTCSATFPPNTVVSLSAASSGLSSFSGYSGACSATTCTMTMTPGTTTSVTAQFTAPPTLTLAAGTGSQGGGTLTSSPSGLSCLLSNLATSGSCTFAYALNTVVTVTQTPTNGSVFLNWLGACTGSGSCQVPLTSARSVQALYRLAVPGAITINAGSGSGAGNVSSSPGGLACTISNGVKSGICRAIFPVGSTVTLVPAVNSGSNFTGFSGACSGMTCVLTVPENGDLTVTANFTP